MEDRKYLALGGLKTNMTFYAFGKEYRLKEYKILNGDIILITKDREFYIKDCYIL